MILDLDKAWTGNLEDWLTVFQEYAYAIANVEGIRADIVVDTIDFMTGNLAEEKFPSVNVMQLLRQRVSSPRERVEISLEVYERLKVEFYRYHTKLFREFMARKALLVRDTVESTNVPHP